MGTRTPGPQQSQQTAAPAEAVTETTRGGRPRPRTAESSAQASILDFQVFVNFEDFSFRAPPSTCPGSVTGAEHLSCKFLQCSYDSLRWQPRTFLEMAFPVPELVSLPSKHRNPSQLSQHGFTLARVSF